MTTKPRFLIVVVFLFSAVSCIPYYIKHNEVEAARESLKMARLLFVSQDFQSAAEIENPDDKTGATVQQLSEFVNKLHTSGVFPTEVFVSEYEPMPGQEAIRIFLTGKNQDMLFRYEFVLVGTEAKGYKVSEIYRFDGEFPQSSMRKQFQMRSQ